MSFRNYIQLAGQRVGTSRAFSDFLTLTVCALSLGEKEDLYKQTSKSYNTEEITAFGNALAELIKEMDDNGKGLKDSLGEYFMEFASNKDTGQFFTSDDICDLMTSLNGNYYFGKTIIDPCCGSGRLFLASARKKRNMFYHGVDIDIRCCYMTLINMCLNNMWGVIEHGDTLRNEVWRRWEIRPHPVQKVPFIRELILSNKTEIKENKEIKKAEKEIEKNIIPAQIQLLFDDIDLLVS